MAVVNGLPGSWWRCAGIVVLPETVVHAVETDLDELEVVPLHAGHEMTHDPEMLARHVVDLVLQPGLVVGAEALDVHRVLTDQPRDLVLHRSRRGVVVLRGVGREKAADADAVDLSRRKARRHADDHGLAPGRAERIPNRRRGDRRGIHRAERIVRMSRCDCGIHRRRASRDPGWSTCTSRPAR